MLGGVLVDQSQVFCSDISTCNNFVCGDCVIFSHSCDRQDQGFIGTYCKEESALPMFTTRYCNLGSRIVTVLLQELPRSPWKGLSNLICTNQPTFLNFLFDDSSTCVVYNMCISACANGSCLACVCAVDSVVDCCCFQIRKKDICKVLGQIHING